MLRTEIWGFLNSEILLQAKLATLLALASWQVIRFYLRFLILTVL